MKLNLTRHQREDGQALSLPPGAVALEVGRAVTLKSQHWQQQRFGFRSHCISIKGQLYLCSILSGTLADDEVSEISLISWEKEESWTTKHLLIISSAQKWHMSLLSHCIG